MGLRTLATRLRKLVGILATNNYRHALLRHGVTAGVEHESLLRGTQYKTAVDIGANRGQFALATRQCVAEARIFSFEPLPAPAARFRALFEADTRVTLHEAAIGPVHGDATIHISKRDDSSSLLPITDRQNATFPGTSEVGTAKVKIAPLGDFLSQSEIESPALLKIDVQGFELQALQGCEPLLNRFDHVYVECSYIELYAGQALADEVIEWLRERGFRLVGIHNAIHDAAGRTIQADFLFSSGVQ
ncbi:MAG: FkbM family methyltransferase [Gemmatimonadaceae bacterium]